MQATDYKNNACHYAQRPIGGTDLLAFYGLQQRITILELSGAALDVGCGSGRSTRFLKSLGFTIVGLDVDTTMIREARRLDPQGHYQLYQRDSAYPFADGVFDVVISTWAVLEINTFASLLHLMTESARVLRERGKGFIVTNTPDFYAHRWLSCEVDFPGNKAPLQSGQPVKARLIPEGICVYDTFWTDRDFRKAFAAAGLHVLAAHYPLAPEGEQDWLDESRIAPFVIYEVEKVG